MHPALLECLEARARHADPRALREAAARLTHQYRARPDQPTAPLREDDARLAYLLVRMPATHAAAACALDQIEPLHSGFAPTSMLDLGAGPGTATFAALERFPTIAAATLVEAEPAWEAEARALFDATGSSALLQWRNGRLPDAIPPEPRDLVVMAYALAELPAAQRHDAVARAWASTRGVLLLVEPGTREGSTRVLEAREALLAAGAHLVAPCPHAAPCPLAAIGEWCHQPTRVARSRRHRTLKGGTLGHEDEKFAYLAVAREPLALPAARLVEAPRLTKGRIERRLCTRAGTLETEVVLRREAAAYREAARAGWGDALS